MLHVSYISIQLEETKEKDVETHTHTEFSEVCREGRMWWRLKRPPGTGSWRVSSLLYLKWKDKHVPRYAQCTSRSNTTSLFSSALSQEWLTLPSPQSWLFIILECAAGFISDNLSYLGQGPFFKWHFRVFLLQWLTLDEKRKELLWPSVGKEKWKWRESRVFLRTSKDTPNP